MMIDAYFGIQLQPRLDSLVGWIWPAGHQLVMTALVTSQIIFKRT